MNKTVCINALDDGSDQPPVQTTVIKDQISVDCGVSGPTQPSPVVRHAPIHRSIVLDYDSDERDLDSALSQLIVYEIHNAGIQSRYALDHELPESPQDLLDQITKGWYTVYMVDGGAVTVYLPFEVINKPHLFTDYFDDLEEDDAEDE